MPAPTPPDQAPTLDYEATTQRARPRADLGQLTLRAVTVYFVASIATLPFLDSLWMGEVPLLALVQLPKVGLADGLRAQVVMPAISAMGLSRGSLSPDFGLARPYALALAYLLMLGVVFGLLRICKRMSPQARRWACVTLIVAAVDFGMTLWFAGGPGLSVY